jgi:hypothetical protein
MTRTLLALAMLLVVATPAGAQVIPIQSFTGTYFEGFETQNSPAFVTCIQGRIFDQHADMCTPTGGGTLISSGWSFQCSISPYAGGKFYGSASGYSEVTFDDPVWRFGGYFGTNGTVGDITFNFYDDNGGQISSEVVSMPSGCTW